MPLHMHSGVHQIVLGRVEEPGVLGGYPWQHWCQSSHTDPGHLLLHTPHHFLQWFVFFNTRTSQYQIVALDCKFAMQHTFAHSPCAVCGPAHVHTRLDMPLISPDNVVLCDSVFIWLHKPSSELFFSDSNAIQYQ